MPYYQRMMEFSLLVDKRPVHAAAAAAAATIKEYHAATKHLARPKCFISTVGLNCRRCSLDGVVDADRFHCVLELGDLIFHRNRFVLRHIAAGSSLLVVSLTISLWTYELSLCAVCVRQTARESEMSSADRAIFIARISDV